MPKVVRDKEMDVPLESLFGVITDFKAYPEFLSEVVSAEVQPGATDKKTRVKFGLDIVKTFEYTLEFSIKDQYTVDWSLVDSNFFKVNSGRWALEKKDDQHTQVHYELEVDFGFFVPKWVSKKTHRN